MIKHAATATSGACTRACTGAHAARRAASRARPGPCGDCTGAPSPTRPLRGEDGAGAAQCRGRWESSCSAPRIVGAPAHPRRSRRTRATSASAEVKRPARPCPSARTSLRSHLPRALLRPVQRSSVPVRTLGDRTREGRRGRRTAPHAEWEDTPLPITSSPPGRQGTPATRPRQSRAKRIVVMPATRPRQCPVPPGFFFAAFLAGLAAHRASGKRIPGSSFFVGSGTCRRKEERLPRLLRIPSDFRRFRAAKPRGCFQVAGLFPRSPARSCQKQCLQKGSPCTTSKIPRWSG